MEDKTQAVAALVLSRLEGYLLREERIDPQKCKHVTATLKDLQDLGLGKAESQQLTVLFDKATEEAAK